MFKKKYIDSEILICVFNLFFLVNLMRLSVTDILTDILYPSSKSEKGMIHV